ncbi:MAG: type II toxin-antitoxin system CcdA family antitoxin [Pseudomonadota bacterium]|nr:type II toxin-antitoxin system CcdA family antitoxin [Pseudomonadota bacterium]
MREPDYDAQASKQTVSITLNSDLYAKAKSLGINTSKVAEESLAREYAARRREAVLAEVRREVAAVEAYENEHGSFPELVRAHYERDDGTV